MVSSYDPYDATSAQYQWLENDLRVANHGTIRSNGRLLTNNTPDRRHHPWLIVCFHSPMYSSNSGHSGGDENFRAAVEHLLLKYRVDLVLTGLLFLFVLLLFYY